MPSYADYVAGGMANNPIDRQQQLESQELANRRLDLLFRQVPHMQAMATEAMALAGDVTLTDDAMLNTATQAVGQANIVQYAEFLAGQEDAYQLAQYSSLAPQMQRELRRLGYEPPEMNEDDGWFSGWEIPFTAPIRGAFSWLPGVTGNGNFKFGIESPTGAFAQGAGMLAEVVTLPGQAIQATIGGGLELMNKAYRLQTRLYRTAEFATGASPVDFIVNPGRFWSDMSKLNRVGVWEAWNYVEDGEEFVLPQYINRAAEILGNSRENVAEEFYTNFRSDLASPAGKLWLAKKVVGGHSLEEIARDFGLQPTDQEWNAFILQAAEIRSEESFAQAVDVLAQGKSSPGRSFARKMGLYDGGMLEDIGQWSIPIPLLPDIRVRDFVSGAGDAAFAIFGDATNVLGGAGAMSKARYIFDVSDTAKVFKAHEIYTAFRKGGVYNVEGITVGLDEAASLMNRATRPQLFYKTATGQKVAFGVDEAIGIQRVNRAMNVLADGIDSILKAPDVSSMRQARGAFARVAPRLAPLIDEPMRRIRDMNLERVASDFDELSRDEMLDVLWDYVVSDKGKAALKGPAGGIDPRFLPLPNMTRVELGVMHTRAYMREVVINPTPRGQSQFANQINGTRPWSIHEMDDTINAIFELDSMPGLSEQERLLRMREIANDAYLKTQQAIEGDGIAAIDATKELVTTGSLPQSISNMLRAFSTHTPHSKDVANLATLETDEFSRIASQLMLAHAPQQLIDEYVGAFAMASEAERGWLTTHLLADIMIRSGAVGSTKHGDESLKLLRQYVTRINHSYSHLDGLDQFNFGGVHTRAGLFDPNFDFRVALPDFRSMAIVSSQMGILRRLGLAHGVTMIDAAMQKYWKPLSIIRLGFIPRAAGEELISFMLRSSPREYVASVMARRASGYTLTRRMDRLGDPDDLIMILGNNEYGIAKLSDANRTSALMAPITGLTHYFRALAKATGKDLLAEAESLLMSHREFRNLTGVARQEALAEMTKIARSQWGTRKRALEGLDDFAWTISNRMANVFHTIATSSSRLPGPEEIGRLMIGRERFDYMVGSAKMMLTNPLITESYMRALGQTFSRYTPLTDLESSARLMPMDVRGKVMYLPMRAVPSKYIKILNPGEAKHLPKGMTRSDAMEFHHALFDVMSHMANDEFASAMLPVLAQFVDSSVITRLDDLIDQVNLAGRYVHADAARMGERLEKSKEFTRKRRRIAEVDPQRMYLLERAMLSGDYDTARLVLDEMLEASANRGRMFSSINRTVETPLDWGDLPDRLPSMVDEWIDEKLADVRSPLTPDEWEDARQAWQTAIANNRIVIRKNEVRATFEPPVVRHDGTTIDFQVMVRPADQIPVQTESVKLGDSYHNLSIQREWLPLSGAYVRDVPADSVEWFVDVARGIIDDPNMNHDVITAAFSSKIDDLYDMTDLEGGRYLAVQAALQRAFPEYEIVLRTTDAGTGAVGIGFDRRVNPDVDPEVLAEAQAHRARSMALYAMQNGEQVPAIPAAGITPVYSAVVQPRHAAFFRQLLDGDDYGEFIYALLRNLTDNLVAANNAAGARGVGVSGAFIGQQSDRIERMVGILREIGSNPEGFALEIRDAFIRQFEGRAPAFSMPILSTTDWQAAQQFSDVLERTVDDWILRAGKEVPPAGGNRQLFARMDIPEDQLSDWMIESHQVYDANDLMTNDPINGTGFYLLPLDTTYAGVGRPINEADLQVVTSYDVKVRSEQENMAFADPTPTYFRPFVHFSEDEAVQAETIERLLEQIPSEGEREFLRNMLLGHVDPDTGQRITGRLVHGSGRQIDSISPIEETPGGHNFVGPGLYSTFDPHEAKNYAVDWDGRTGIDGAPTLHSLQWNHQDRLPRLFNLENRVYSPATDEGVQAVVEQLRSRLRTSADGNLWDREIDAEELFDYIDRIDPNWHRGGLLDEGLVAWLDEGGSRPVTVGELVDYYLRNAPQDTTVRAIYFQLRDIVGYGTGAMRGKEFRGMGWFGRDADLSRIENEVVIWLNGAIRDAGYDGITHGGAGWGRNRAFGNVQNNHFIWFDQGSVTVDPTVPQGTVVSERIIPVSESSRSPLSVGQMQEGNRLFKAVEDQLSIEEIGGRDAGYDIWNANAEISVAGIRTFAGNNPDEFTAMQRLLEKQWDTMVDVFTNQRAHRGRLPEYDPMIRGMQQRVDELDAQIYALPDGVEYDQAEALLIAERQELVTSLERRRANPDGPYNHVTLVDRAIRSSDPVSINDDLNLSAADIFKYGRDADLPHHIYAPEMVPTNVNWFDHFVRTSFDGMISPAIDAIFRSHFFLINFDASRRQLAWMLDSGLRSYRTAGLTLQDRREMQASINQAMRTAGPAKAPSARNPNVLMDVLPTDAERYIWTLDPEGAMVNLLKEFMPGNVYGTDQNDVTKVLTDYTGDVLTDLAEGRYRAIRGDAGDIEGLEVWGPSGTQPRKMTISAGPPNGDLERFVAQLDIYHRTRRLKDATPLERIATDIGMTDRELDDFLGVVWQQAQLDPNQTPNDAWLSLARAFQNEVYDAGKTPIPRLVQNMATDARGALLEIGVPAEVLDDVLPAIQDTDAWLALRRDITRQANVYKDYAQASAHRAVELTIPFIDDHNIRSQFQEYVGNLVPFWFAEEQFLKRWARGLYQNPAMLRRGQLTMNGFRNIGLIREDENGNEIFVYPGSGVLFDVVSPMAAVVFGANFGSVIQGNLGSRTEYMFPGLNDSAGTMQFGPMIAIPVHAIANRNPEFNNFRDELLGEAGNLRAGGTIGDYREDTLAMVFDNLLPTPIKRVYSILTQQGFNREELASAKMQAMAYLAAAGHQPAENASATDKEEYLDRVDNTARLILSMRSMTSLVGGSTMSPIDWDEVELLTEFRELVDALPFEEAIEAFIEKHPDATPYTVFGTRTEAGAPIAATQEVFDYINDNGDFMSSFPMLSPWLLPQGQPDAFGPKERRARNQVIARGMRINKSPEELLTAYYVASASEDYFDIVNEYDTQILMARIQGDTETARAIEMEMKVWKQGYLQQHPVFAEEISSTSGKDRRQQVVDQARLALATVTFDENTFEVLDTGIIPDTPHGRDMLQLIRMLVRYTDDYSALSGITSGLATERRKLLAMEFLTMTEAMVEDNPTLRTFWNSNIRPIVADAMMEREVLEVLA